MLFKRSAQNREIGVVFDIGSTSVTATIVTHLTTGTFFEIVWNHTENTLLQREVAKEQAAKNVFSALMNCALELATSGIPEVSKRYPGVAISTVKYCVAAPWSYTITKSVTYSEDEPFLITEELLDSIQDTAERKIAEEFQTNDIARDLGLEITTKVVTNIVANGYNVPDPVNEYAQTVKLANVNVVMQSKLSEALNEVTDKVFPKVEVEKLSYILMFYCVVRDLFPTVQDYSLVNVTNEATELGVVRDNVLQFSTHTETGILTMARKITKDCNIPFSEAISIITSNEPDEKIAALTSKQREAVRKAQHELITTISTLFQETGDGLSIPKSIFVRSIRNSHHFVGPLIKQAANLVTRTDHTTHNITDDILMKLSTQTTDDLSPLKSYPDAILSSRFFHKCLNCEDITFIK